MLSLDGEVISGLSLPVMTALRGEPNGLGGRVHGVEECNKTFTAGYATRPREARRAANCRLPAHNQINLTKSSIYTALARRIRKVALPCCSKKGLTS